MERIDDLEIRNYKIYQDSDSFCFGVDSVLLANFALRNIRNKNNQRLRVADLCTGNIAVALIFYAKKDFDAHIDCIDIDEYQLSLAKKSIEINKSIDENIVNDINIINDDINNILVDKERYKSFLSSFELITINPPYIKEGKGLQSENEKKLYARHELKISFDTICKISYNMLKSNKSLYLVHRTNRLSEIISTLKSNNLEPKTIQFVHAFKDKPSNLFLLEAIKDAGEETKVLEPIIIYEKENVYTKEVLDIYGK